MVGTEVTKKTFIKSSRVKGLDIHPTLPWVLISMHSGTVQIWNYESNSMIRNFDVDNVPVRSSKFIPSKSWITCCTDNGKIIVYNLNTYEKIATIDAHSDYIRSIAIHPTLPYILSCSDDYTIKMWDWERNWTEVMLYESHRDYVMKVVFNPIDTSVIASASMDTTIKMWSIDNHTPKFTLEGHTAGVNDVEFYRGPDKPYIISASEDKSIKIWDYLLKSCVHTVVKHSYGVTSAAFLPDLSFFASASEDGTVRIWDSDTYHMEIALNYDPNRVWTLAYAVGKSEIAIGHDNGTAIVMIGGDSKPISLDSAGKLMISLKKEVHMSNLATLNIENIEDCEVLKLTYKDMGICEIYPQKILHSNNSRFIAVIGGGEYVIYSALAWRVRSFGKAVDFVWGPASLYYALRETGGIVSIKKNFQDNTVINPIFVYKKICGGPLLALIGDEYVYFYEWDKGNCVGRIDVSVKDIIWSESDVFALVCEDMVYIIKQKFTSPSTGEENYNDNNENDENAVNILLEIPEGIKSGCWVGTLFFYLNNTNKVTYYYNFEPTVIATVPYAYNIYKYVTKLDALVLIDKDCNVSLVRFPKVLVHCQELVASDRPNEVIQFVEKLTNNQRNILAKYLEAKGHHELALEITTNVEFKFELTLILKKYDLAVKVAESYGQESMWLRIAEAAIGAWDYDLVELASKKANDIKTLFMLYISTRNIAGLEYVAECAEKNSENNLVLMCNYVMGRFEECVRILSKFKCHSEAMIAAKKYAPHLLEEMTASWNMNLKTSRTDSNF